MSEDRPYFSYSGAQLIELIHAGDPLALAESAHRRVPTVRTVARAAGVVYQPPTRKATKTTRKSGPGSRGGRPDAFVRGQYATRAGHVPNSPEWWTAYKSAEAKKLAADVTTFAQAEKVLASL